VFSLSWILVQNIHAASSLLILPFDNATGQAEYRSLEKGIPDLLTAFLAPQSDVIQVVERERLESVMAEQSLNWESLIKEGQSLSRVGQLVQARYIVRGSITAVGKKVLLQAGVYETETTRLVKSSQAEGSMKDLNQMCEKLAGGILASITPADRKPDSRSVLPLDPDPQRNIQLIYGMGYFHHSQYAKAIPEFMKMLSRNEQDVDARYWLIQSYRKAGMKDHADFELQEFGTRFPKDDRFKKEAR